VRPSCGSDEQRGDTVRAVAGRRPTSVEEFTLRFPADQIPALAARFFSAGGDSGAAQAGRSARQRGYYTKAEFMLVCRWKSQRSAGRAEANTPAEIRRATRAALAPAADEDTRMNALTGLNGVGVPVASTLLHFAFPDRYPILDVRALESLGRKPRSPYPVSFWMGYVEACRRIALDNDVSMRTLDKALWQHSSEASRNVSREGTGAPPPPRSRPGRGRRSPRGVGR
jgi:hypothetical protein